MLRSMSGQFDARAVRKLLQQSFAIMSDHELVEYITKAASLGVDGMRKVCSFARAFLAECKRRVLQEFAELQAAAAASESKSHAAFDANPSRNRSPEMVCIDETRVVLKREVPPETDYM